MRGAVCVVSVLTIFLMALVFEAWAQQTTATTSITSGGQCNKTCPTVQDQVCGTDGMTYCNECTLNNTNCQRPPDRQIRIDYRGACRSRGRWWSRG